MAQLQVTLVEGRNFKQKDTFSETDAYVKMYLDDRNHKQKSKTKQNSNNPVWNQSFIFNHMSGQDTLHLDIYDKDSLKDERIGSINVDLRDLYQKGHIDRWFDIPAKSGSASCGEIHLILHFDKLQTPLEKESESFIVEYTKEYKHWWRVVNDASGFKMLTDNDAILGETVGYDSLSFK